MICWLLYLIEVSISVFKITSKWVQLYRRNQRPLLLRRNTISISTFHRGIGRNTTIPGDIRCPAVQIVQLPAVPF